jgi:hypothetical protein
MSDAILTRLARLDCDALLEKLREVEQQRRLLLALLRARPRVKRRKRREASHAG